MNRRIASALVAGVVAAAFAVAATTSAAGTAASTAQGDQLLPMPISISDRLKHRKAPEQLSKQEAEGVVAAAATTVPQCGDGGTGDFLTITIPSFDPENPGSQDVVFWRETPSTASGNATLWVAWDFLTTAFGREDVITCEQLEYLQSQMDHIVESDKKYFGDYDLRPAGNENIDVMIYNIVDESYFDEEFASYIAGFFWSAINDVFDRNMVFVDSYDWENRLGPDAAIPYLYEGTVAHELEHLIHNDHDPDELSWIDEGMADLAEYLAGYGHPDGHVVYYLAFHRTPLTIWGSQLEDYGASYLFQLYLLEQYGTETGGVWDPAWTKRLIDEQDNGIEGVEDATGTSFDPLFDAWVLANYVDRPVMDGPGGHPLGYDTIDLTPYASPRYGPWSIKRAVTDVYGADHHGNLPISRYFGGFQSGTVEFPLGDVAPYTPVYGTYKGAGPGLNVSFRGNAQAGVEPPEGSYEMASGGGNMLTDRMLVLDAALPGGGTLSFQTWFDIEEEWDYGFVEVSTDGGASWSPLAGSITRESSNPNASTAWANSLVGGQTSTDAAITGSTEGEWVDAEFAVPVGTDMVRFSYYTDEAVNGQGWFIDDLSIDGFSDGFESDNPAWDYDGWERTTGLFDNDWMVGHAVPSYQGNKETGFAAGAVEAAPAGGFLRASVDLDTSRLGADSAMVVFANRPGDSPFSAGYLSLVSKTSAKK